MARAASFGGNIEHRRPHDAAGARFPGPVADHAPGDDVFSPGTEGLGGVEFERLEDRAFRFVIELVAAVVGAGVLTGIPDLGAMFDGTGPEMYGLAFVIRRRLGRLTVPGLSGVIAQTLV